MSLPIPSLAIEQIPRRRHLPREPLNMNKRTPNSEPRTACHCSKVDRTGQKNSKFEPKWILCPDGKEVPKYRSKSEREAGRMLAKEIATREGVEAEAVPLHHMPPLTPITVEQYRRTEKIRWPCNGDGGRPEGFEVDRSSTAQSSRSRHRAAWTFLNAETNWCLMMTLTYPAKLALDYERVAHARTKFLKRWRRKFGRSDYGWILEFTAAGTPHYHLFIGDKPGDRIIGESNVVTIERKGKSVDIIRGGHDRWIANAWLASAGLTSNDSAQRFNHGGITELLRSADAAGRYVAKEASKRVQKSAPWPVSQWWYLSRDLTPQKRHESTMTVLDFMRSGHSIMVSRLWENIDIKES